MSGSIPNKELAEFLTKRWSNGLIRSFEVNTPCKLTVWRGSRYATESFIGEEPLTPLAAYVGKKGEVILRFGFEDQARETNWVEMPVAHAKSYLDDFHECMRLWSDECSDLQMKAIREVGAAKEETADTDARRQEDPLFGSW